MPISGGSPEITNGVRAIMKVLFDSPDRTLIYTALTRGMEQVVFGDRNAFDAAVTAMPRSHERHVGSCW